MLAYSANHRTRSRTDGPRSVLSPAEVKASFRKNTRPFWAELNSQLESIKALRASPPPATREDAIHCKTMTLGSWTRRGVTVATSPLDYSTWGPTAELKGFFDAAIRKVPRDESINSYEGQQFAAARSLLSLDPSPERTAVWDHIFRSSADEFSKEARKVEAERKALLDTLATIITPGLIPETVWQTANTEG